MTRPKSDILSVIEAAYRLERNEEEWLAGVGRAAYGQIGAGLGLYGFHYTVASDGKLNLGPDFNIDTPPHLTKHARSALEMLPPQFVRKTFARCECTTQSAATDAEMQPLVDGAMALAEREFGWRDILILGGMDPSGTGVYLGAWLSAPKRLTSVESETWNRVAVHIVTAARLRRRLGSRGLSVDDSEAVLDANGNIQDAQGEARSSDARHALAAAVRAVERARGELRHDDPHVAVAGWSGLVKNRWSLVDYFESQGKRYVLARENQIQLRGPQALSSRERQALAYAMLGHTNKLIAYEMGVSASTVGVLLHRAARKLGVRTREELLETAQRITFPDSKPGT